MTDWEYTKDIAVEMAKDVGVLIRSHFVQPEKPIGWLLVDSHAHFDRRLCKDKESLAQLVDIMFKSNVDFQAVCDYGVVGRSVDHVITYNEFVEALRTVENVEIEQSDRYATRARRGDRRIVFTQGREFETALEDSRPGFLHDHHSVHIAVEGADVQPGTTYKVLYDVEEQGGHASLAHPFTLPAKKAVFWYANAEEEQNLLQISSDFNVFIEGHNAPNTLWMVVNNGRARAFARKHDIPLIWNSDMHARPNLDLVRRQMGIAGTLVTALDFWDVLYDARDFTGKELIEMKYASIRKRGKGYGNVMTLPLFWNVMAKPMITGKY